MRASAEAPVTRLRLEEVPASVEDSADVGPLDSKAECFRLELVMEDWEGAEGWALLADNCAAEGWAVLVDDCAVEDWGITGKDTPEDCSWDVEGTAPE